LTNAPNTDNLKRIE